MHQACLWGEFDITMLYVRHKPLWWDPAKYAFYLAGGFFASGKCLDLYYVRIQSKLLLNTFNF